jgi:hypothetical protein
LHHLERRGASGLKSYGVVALLQKPRELFYCKSSLPNERPKSSFSHFFVVGNGKTPVRWIGASKDDVAPVLLIEFVSGFSECLDRVTARNHWQLHPPETSITSSIMLGGTGSPCLRRLFK